MTLSKKQMLLASRILDQYRMETQDSMDRMEGLGHALGKNAKDELEMVESILLTIDENLKERVE